MLIKCTYTASVNKLFKQFICDSVFANLPFCHNAGRGPKTNLGDVNIVNWKIVLSCDEKKLHKLDVVFELSKYCDNA